MSRGQRAFRSQRPLLCHPWLVLYCKIRTACACLQTLNDMYMWQVVFEWWRERECHSTETPLRRETSTSSLTSSSLKTTGSTLKNWTWVTLQTHQSVEFSHHQAEMCLRLFLFRTRWFFSGTGVFAARSCRESRHRTRRGGSWPDRLWQESRVRRRSQERGL